MTHRIIIKDLLPWIAAVAGGILAFLGYAGFDHFYLNGYASCPSCGDSRAEPHPSVFYRMGCRYHHELRRLLLDHIHVRAIRGLSWPLALLGLLLLAAANGIVLAVWAGATRS